MRECISHHYACDCRERAVKEVVKAARGVLKTLKDDVKYHNIILADDTVGYLWDMETSLEYFEEYF